MFSKSGLSRKKPFQSLSRQPNIYERGNKKQHGGGGAPAMPEIKMCLIQRQLRGLDSLQHPCAGLVVGHLDVSGVADSVAGIVKGDGAGNALI